MDFFERWFGVSPDGGNGTAEALWLAAIVAAVVVIAARRRVFSLIRRGSKRN